MNLTQILRGQSAILTLSVYADGDLSDEGTPTLTLTDLDGNAESITPVTDNTDGTYTATIDARDDLDLLYATLDFGSGLSFTQGTIEIVGNHLFTEAQARAFQDDRLEETTKFTDEAIAAERIRATDWLEAHTGISWVPRYRRVTLRGTNTDSISLYDTIASDGPSGGEGATQYLTKVISATVDGTALDTADIEIEGHRLWLVDGTWTWAKRPNIVIEYEYGHRHLRNGVDRIALLELVNRLPASRLSANAESSSDEFGSYGWAPQNNGRPSRNPEVNAWLRNQDARAPIA